MRTFDDLCCSLSLQQQQQQLGLMPRWIYITASVILAIGRWCTQCHLIYLCLHLKWGCSFSSFPSLSFSPFLSPHSFWPARAREMSLTTTLNTSKIAQSQQDFYPKVQPRSSAERDNSILLHSALKAASTDMAHKLLDYASLDKTDCEASCILIALANHEPLVSRSNKVCDK